MGYHITISRCPDDPEKDPITFEEWKGFVEAHPRLKILSPLSDEPNPELRQPYHAVEVEGIPDSWLGWTAGSIWTGYPDPELMKFMVEIAPSFGAIVHGDEGEVYHTPEDCDIDLDAPLPRKTFWERELTMGNLTRMILLIVVGILIYLSKTGKIPGR